MTDNIDPSAVCGFTPQDYWQVVSDLLPWGDVWPRDPETVQQRTMAGIAVEFSRLHARTCDLLAEGWPGTATESIDDWERVMGLPDPCTGPLATLEARRRAILAKMASNGDPTVANITAYLQSLGFEVEIVEGPDPYEFTVYAAADTSIWFRAGMSLAGDRLRTWGDNQLQCAIDYNKPAHTVANLVYLVPAEWDEGGSLWDNDLSIWDQGAKPPS